MTAKIILCTFLLSSWSFDQLNEKEILKLLDGDKVKSDPENGDGTYLVRNKKSKKWGMFQWLGSDTPPETLIPMKYDSIRFFPWNGKFTAVFTADKVGIYLSKWSYYEEAKQTIPCLYNDYQRFTFNNITYLAMLKNTGWGWVDWLTGEEKTPFQYSSSEDLPHPNWIQKQFY